MTKVQTKKQYSMTEGPLLGKMLKYALPLMATGLLQVLYNASDMIVVGRFSSAGSVAMGAVGSCGPLINLLVNAFMGLSVGTGICVAQGIGAGRHKEVKDVVHTSLLGGLICGIFVGVFGFLMCEPLLKLMMGSGEETARTLAQAVPYMQAYFVGMPAMMVYNFLAAALRSSGDTKRPLIFLSISGLLNVGLNLVMVLCFGMGAVGVGIATTVAQYASAIMILVYMCRYDGLCKVNLREVRMKKDDIVAVVRNGLPAGIQSVVFSISNVLIQSTINSYGDAVIAGSAAAGNLEGFIYVAMNSLYQTAMTFAGQNVGAEKIERVKRVGFIAVTVVIITGLVIGAACLLFSDQLLSIYINEKDPVLEEQVFSAGLLRLEIISTTYFLCGVMEVLSGLMRGMGKPLIPMVVSILGSCVLRIAWIIVICNSIFPGQISYLYIAYPVTWLITSTAHLVCCVATYKHLIRQRDARNALLAEAEAQNLTGERASVNMQ
ncbi:MAG: MATE family efflux transporter [Clostridia bacterium]|nr:MATE family efflux transporter [Clostridia bacterium]